MPVATRSRAMEYAKQDDQPQTIHAHLNVTLEEAPQASPSLCIL
jgi:hypothetical protein